jgi:hypothetical protein
MTISVRKLARASLVLFGVIVSGCQGSVPESAMAAADTREVDREAAVASARRDAWLRYREIPVSEIGAQRLGGFWIVELRSPSGSGLRYAISTTDGTIRERSTFQ